MKTVLFFISSTRHTCRNRLEGIYRYAREHDWHVQVVERAFHKVDVRRQLDFWRPIGVIAECGSGADELTNDAFGALPVVFFDADRSKRGPGFYVGSDGVSIGRLAAAHLLVLKLPNYAYASFRLPLFWDRERRDAFVSEVTQAGKGCSVFAPEREQLPHARQVELAEWVRSLPLPCGIFAANDYVGEEIVNICEQLGLSVPDDIAVLGVDNDEEICENTTTTLSSLAPDFTAGGYLAAELLGKLIANPRLRPMVIQFPVSRAVTRRSTRRIVCDRYGIYVVAEANVEGHGYWYGKEGLGNQPEWYPVIVERNARQAVFYRNNPSIVFWSMGNETGHGDGFRQAMAEVRRLDPTRFVHFERGNRDADIDSTMYPFVDWLEERGKAGDGLREAPELEWEIRHGYDNPQTKGKPYFSCEYAHAMGNAMGNFAEYWDVFYAHESLSGGCIWDRADQAVWKETDRLDPKTGRRERYLAYGADFDEPIKAGVPIAFVTSTHALENWKGDNPLVLVGGAEWNGEDRALVKRLAAQGVKTVAVDPATCSDAIGSRRAACTLCGDEDTGQLSAWYVRWRA